MNKTQTLLTSVALLTLTTLPALSQVQTPNKPQAAPVQNPSSAPILAPDPVSSSLATFEKDFSDYVNMAESEAINGPKKLELAEKMKRDAVAWFGAMQSRLTEKSKENASLNDRISKLNTELNSTRVELTNLRLQQGKTPTVIPRKTQTSPQAK